MARRGHVARRRGHGSGGGLAHKVPACEPSVASTHRYRRHGGMGLLFWWMMTITDSSYRWLEGV